MQRRAGRLFWKFFVSQWVGMVVSLAVISVYFQLTGRKPPPQPGDVT